MKKHFEISHINEKTVKNAVNTVFQIKKDWINRQQCFYTLGKCAYIDGKSKSYYTDLERNNKLLYGCFSELYLLVMNALSNLMEEEVLLTKNLALPGFHIFRSSPKFLIKGGDWHKDLTHKTLNLKGNSPYSFTLPIKIPTGGAGIDYIDSDLSVKSLDYELGGLVLHNGLIPHRISKLKKYCKNEYRITMQGHLIKINNKIEAYF